MKIEGIVERIKLATDLVRWGGTWRHDDLWAPGLFINSTAFYWNLKEEQRKSDGEKEKRGMMMGREGSGQHRRWGKSGFSVLIKIFQHDLFFICWIQWLPPARPSDSTTTARSTVALLHAVESSLGPLAVSVETQQPLAVLSPGSLSAPVRVNVPASQCRH